MRMPSIDALVAKMIYIVLVVFTNVWLCFPSLYCLSLILVAHTEPNAGYEERRHKWTKYTKAKPFATS